MRGSVHDWAHDFAWATGISPEVETFGRGWLGLEKPTVPWVTLACPCRSPDPPSDLGWTSGGS